MTTQTAHLAAALALLAGPALAEEAPYLGSVEAVGRAEDAGTARGTVFLDADRDSRLDPGEAGVAGVAVSNGREVVLTDAHGRYAIPARDDMNLFVTKPAGHAVPVSDQMVPQFAYLHKPAGSPPLRFGGLEPTGPLPAEVNFPLIETGEDGRFEVLVFGDAQAYSNREIGYVRQSVGALLAGRDMSRTRALVFVGDMMGDDLSLFPRLKDIVAVGGTPQYFVGGNHDIDFDAGSDEHSFDTFRREWGPEYYSFDVGRVHFVVLDNVRYPCNGVDAHRFCDPDGAPAYNGVVHERQMAWLADDLAHVPEDHLIVLAAHIPFQTFVNAATAKHQTDNLAELARILGDRPVLGLAGHTHTTENLAPGTAHEGWEENTGLARAPFRQIVAGAVSGAWWQGDLDDEGVPHATQALGAPRGYYRIAFDGPDYVETYHAFGRRADDGMHASFSTPRFRDWAGTLLAFAGSAEAAAGAVPPVTRHDLGDTSMITTDDLAGGTWVAVNVWNGSAETEVAVSIDGGPPIAAARTQPGEGEAMRRGPEHADPLALALQSTQGDMAVRSTTGGEATAGYRTFRGAHDAGAPGPFRRGGLAEGSSHLWRADLPADLAPGVHTMTVEATDRHGRTLVRRHTFEVVDEIPNPDWQAELFEAAARG